MTDPFALGNGPVWQPVATPVLKPFRDPKQNVAAVGGGAQPVQGIMLNLYATIAILGQPND